MAPAGIACCLIKQVCVSDLYRMQGFFIAYMWAQEPSDERGKGAHHYFS